MSRADAGFVRSQRAAMILSALAAIGSNAWAGPTGGNVVAGSAEIRATNKQTDIIQSSNRAVIDWRGFSIDAGEAVYFRQPSTQAATLNRVTGDQASRILGTLSANGQVILLNPNGILFGQGSRVDVGSLIASTAWMDTKDFMAGASSGGECQSRPGCLNFSVPAKAGGSIVNQGTISAKDGGLVALVAPHVRNDGLIWARLGRIVLGAGSSFAVDLNGDGLVSLAVLEADLQNLRDVNGQPVSARLEQFRNETSGSQGTLAAAGGAIHLIAAHDAKGVVDRVINLGGIVRADTAERNATGTIVLRAENGRVDVSGELLAIGLAAGQIGGTIKIEAPRVALASSARVHATGEAGGGSINIGSSDASRAQAIEVAAAAVLDTSAEQTGNGGGITLTAERIEFRGTAYARGGESGGNGGSVVLDTTQQLVVDGAADAAARAGTAGTLHLRYGAKDVLVKHPNEQTKDSTAVTMSRTMRTGTNVAVETNGAIEIAADIDGRGGLRGGGLKLAGAGGVFFKGDVYTNGGTIDIDSSKGQVFMNDNRLLSAEDGTITVKAQKNAVLYHLVTRGDVKIESMEGNVELRARLGYDRDGNGNPYALKSLTVRAVAGETKEGEHFDDPTRGNVQMFDVAVAKDGSIDVHAARNIQILEKIDSGTRKQLRAGIDQARAGEGNRRLRLHSNRLGEPGADVGSLTNNARYWENFVDPRTRATIPYAAINYFDKGTNTTRADERWVDLNKAAKRPGDATRVSPGTQVVLRDARETFDPVARREALSLTDIRPVELSIPEVPRIDETALDNTRMQRSSEALAKVDAAIEEEEDESYSGGRGVAQLADVGRAPANKPSTDVFAAKEHVVELRTCAAPVVVGNTYFQASAFGSTSIATCR